ncbi:ABC transporter permease [Kordiimonas marina]|uniref:ABC transporter permease n=1 Tax=Kordiimonas marina TaxID=2872312 RepID=UPI001FF1AE9F|nr:ABC transporter permease [Kordiimonas marina]MCJ9428009.1 ABC transporter permease [Kordiimonas marina]
MFQNYLNVALRNLIKHKLYSAINIIGLAVGLAACILISLYVRDELSFDKFWSNANNIYRLQTTFKIPGREPFVTVMAQGPSKHALKEYFSEDIDKVTRFNNMNTILRYKGGVYSQEMMWTDPETADMFSFDVVEGDIHKALHDNASLAISQSLAKKYFGDEDPLGKVVTVNVHRLQRDYRVAAVFKDLPHNTVLKFDALAMIDEKDFAQEPWEFTQWFSVNNYVYFTLKPGVNIARVNDQLAAFTNKNITMPSAITGGQKRDASSFITYDTLALPDVELHSPRSGMEMKAAGSLTTVIIFSAIAGLILLIACINFMNLATAKSTQRAREVALRKVLGAKRGQLVLQFIGESVFIAAIGLVLGFVLVELALPAFNQFIGKDMVFNYGDPVVLLLLVGLTVTVGVLGGAYPALVLSGFLPARVLKANKSAETSGSMRLRSVLVVVQFSISIALIIATGVVYGQKLYATNMNPGFNKDNLLVIHNVGRTGARDKQEALKQEILRMPNVTSAAFSDDTPGTSDENNTSVKVPGSETDQSILLGVQNVDYDFLKTYQIKLLAGRNYSRDRTMDGVPDGSKAKDGEMLPGTVILNVGALRRLGFGTPKEAIGKQITMGIAGPNGKPAKTLMTVIGVIPEIHFQTLKNMLRPEMYLYRSHSPFDSLTVRFKGNPEALIKRIEGTWKSMITTVPYEYDFVDQNLAEAFDREANTSILLGIFSGLAIIIACLGLYGLASFTAERRTKEIGIRKVMGATVFDVVRLLIWQFSKPVLIANLIAWPVAAYGLMRWLQNFPYRLDSWYLVPCCIAAGLLALLVAWVTVGGNAAKVARANPIKALRYE